jgi:hypothetical protein
MTVSGPGAAAIHLTGRTGGEGNAIATISATEDPLEVLSTCAGSGLQSVRVDLSLVAQRLSGESTGATHFGQRDPDALRRSVRLASVRANNHGTAR